MGTSLEAALPAAFLRAPAPAHAWPTLANAVPGALLTLTAAPAGGAAARALAAWTSSRRSP